MPDLRKIKSILAKTNNVKVAVYGDFCLDAYWFMDPRGSEVSVETGLMAEAVTKQKYSLGGAGNIVANLAVLNPAEIKTIGVVGDDIFGRELQQKLNQLNVDTSGLVIQEDSFDTVVFSKRYLRGEEKPRIDFGFFNKRTAKTDMILLQSIKSALKSSDVIILNQQVPGSITNPSFIDNLNLLIKEFPDKLVLMDSRHYADKFTNVFLKTNQVEAAILNGKNTVHGDTISISELRNFAAKLFDKYQRPVFISRGENGLIGTDGRNAYNIPGIQLIKQVDPVGAGDTMISALACCLGIGETPASAAEFANYASAVTVQKLFQTGTASGKETLDMAAEASFIHDPELAENAEKANYLRGTRIEVCANYDSNAISEITHAVFDHDGTISTLREGWEAVMEPMMINAILGNKYQETDELTRKKVTKRVRQFIDNTTGIQTILQMDGLIDLIKEFGFVPNHHILDKFEYKKMYNDALMKTVDERLTELKSGRSTSEDFSIPGSIQFLEELRNRGVTLYLASGTDVEDVVNEATIMGYADLFNGGIYGAVGDVSKYSKKKVMREIIKNYQLNGAELATFGDGPVEIQECVRNNGIAIGIASDEIHGGELNLDKRCRLIKAGARLILRDFSESETLLKILLN
ncbi:MAG: HAD family hydrolase [Candidatus Marinimicrobia bacterium]|nr:HAD family hydrolase [Candidatus Neomarinimicrobiota bacterium]